MGKKITLTVAISLTSTEEIYLTYCLQRLNYYPDTPGVYFFSYSENFFRDSKDSVINFIERFIKEGIFIPINDWRKEETLRYSFGQLGIALAEKYGVDFKN